MKSSTVILVLVMGLLAAAFASPVAESVAGSEIGDIMEDTDLIRNVEELISRSKRGAELCCYCAACQDSICCLI